MRSHPWQGSALAATVSAALLFAGCARSPTTRYHTLLPLAPARGSVVMPERRLGVGPVRLPAHLRQASLVRRTDVYRVAYGDFDVWADPLEDSLVEVVAENLARLTGARRVLRHPWPYGEAPDCQISLDVQALELALDGQAELAVRWEIRDARGVLLDSGEASQREPAHGQIGELAEALSRALLALSRDLAAAVAR